jgi:recombinational DNA repair protein (RecF pathway)
MALTRRQRLAVPVLVSTRTNKESAQVLGVSLRTIQRWLADEEFKAELRKAEIQATDQAVRRLIGSQGLVITQLITILNSPNAKDSDRLKAGQTLLELSTRLLDVRDYNERLYKLEVYHDIKKP